MAYERRALKASSAGIVQRPGATSGVNPHPLPSSPTPAPGPAPPPTPAPSKCKHAGVWSNMTSKCSNCAGAWSGTLCDVWDSSVSVKVLLHKMEVLTNGSQAELNEQAKLNPLCKQNTPCAGWGVDAATGSATMFPMVSLTYTNPSRTFIGKREPVEATVSARISRTFFSLMYTSKHKVSPNSDPHLVVTSTQAFAGIGEYVN